MLFTIGRVCIKLAGRDAGKHCVIVDEVAPGTVLIDGQTRRRNCNVHHLEPTNKVVDLEKGATSAAVADALVAMGISVEQKKTSTKSASKRPVKQHVQRAKK